METIILRKHTAIPIATTFIIDEENRSEFNTLLFPYRISTQDTGDTLSKAAVERWLEHRLGEDFDEVYVAFQREIQPKYLEGHPKGIFWFVEKKSAILMDKDGRPRYKGGLWYVHGFYVNPETNQLCRID